MEPEAYIGVRVVRGPHWLQTFGNQDGGEGHVGTIVDVCGIKANDFRPKQCVIVQWDAGGTPITYRAGHQNAFDLSIYDNAGVGVKHNTTCSGCNVCRVYGLLWICDKCRDVHLCSACYSSNCHELNHQFTRLTFPSDSRHIVPTRGTSERLQAIGIFENSTVVRGPDWLWKEQDGGPGKEGVVIAIVNFRLDTDRNAAEVTWNTGYTNIYRLGYKGLVDVKCSKSAIGGFYYRGHLPVVKLDALGNESFTDVELRSQKAETPSPVEHESVNQKQRFMAGDKVRIEIDADTFKMMEQCRRTWNKRKTQWLGRTGIVVMTTGDVVSVDFDTGHLCELHEAALTKVSEMRPGEIIQVNGSREEVKKLQDARGGWNDLMAKVLGKKGRVIKIDDDGDINVAFGDYTWTFNPECLKPSSGDADTDVYSSTNVSKSSLEDLTVMLQKLEEDVDDTQSHTRAKDETIATEDMSEILGVSMDEAGVFPDNDRTVVKETLNIQRTNSEMHRLTTDEETCETPAINVQDKRHVDFIDVPTSTPKDGNGNHAAPLPTDLSDSILVMTTGDNDSVEFETGRLCELHQAALTKVSEISPGEIIQVNSSMEEVKKLQNARGGWNDLMTKVLGKKGRVIKIDDDGDINVAFGDYAWTFNPECLKPSSGDPDKDMYSSTNVSKSSLEDASPDRNPFQPKSKYDGLKKTSSECAGESTSTAENRKPEDMSETVHKKIEQEAPHVTEQNTNRNRLSNKEEICKTPAINVDLQRQDKGPVVCIDVPTRTPEKRHDNVVQLHNVISSVPSPTDRSERVQDSTVMLQNVEEDVDDTQSHKRAKDETIATEDMSEILGVSMDEAGVFPDNDRTVVKEASSIKRTNSKMHRLTTDEETCEMPAINVQDKRPVVFIDVPTSTSKDGNGNHAAPIPSDVSDSILDSTVMLHNLEEDVDDTPSHKWAKDETTASEDMSEIQGVRMDEAGVFPDNDRTVVKETSSIKRTNSDMNPLTTDEETCETPAINVDQQLQDKRPVDFIDVPKSTPEDGHGDHDAALPTDLSDGILETDSTLMQQQEEDERFEIPSEKCAKVVTITTEYTSETLDASKEEVTEFPDNSEPLVQKTSNIKEIDDDMNQLPNPEEIGKTPAIIVDQDVQYKLPVDFIDVTTRPPEADHGDGVQLHNDYHTPPSPTRHNESVEGTMTRLTVMQQNREGDYYGTCAKEETITTEDTSKIMGVRIEKVGASRDNYTPLVKKTSSTNEADDDINQLQNQDAMSTTPAIIVDQQLRDQRPVDFIDVPNRTLEDVRSDGVQLHHDNHIALPPADHNKSIEDSTVMLHNLEVDVDDTPSHKRAKDATIATEDMSEIQGVSMDEAGVFPDNDRTVVKETSSIKRTNSDMNPLTTDEETYETPAINMDQQLHDKRPVDFINVPTSTPEDGHGDHAAPLPTDLSDGILVTLTDSTLLLQQEEDEGLEITSDKGAIKDVTITTEYTSETLDASKEEVAEFPDNSEPLVKKTSNIKEIDDDMNRLQNQEETCTTPEIRVYQQLQDKRPVDFIDVPSRTSSEGHDDCVQLHHDNRTALSPADHSESIEGTMIDSTVMQQNGDGDGFDTCAKVVTNSTEDMSELMNVSMEEVGAFYDNDTTLVQKTSSTNETNDDMNQLPTPEETCTTPAIIVDQDLQHKAPVDFINVPTRPPEAGHSDEVQLHHDHHTPPSPTRHNESIEGTMTDSTVMQQNGDGDDLDTCAKEVTITTKDMSDQMGVSMEEVGTVHDNDTTSVKKTSSTNETNDDMNQLPTPEETCTTPAIIVDQDLQHKAPVDFINVPTRPPEAGHSDEVQLHHDHHTPPSPSRHNESIEGTMTDSTVMQQNGGGDDFDTCAKEMTISTKDMSDQMGVSMEEVGTVHDNDTTSVKKTSSTNDTNDDMNQLPTPEETCTTPVIIVDQDLQHKAPVDFINVPIRPPEAGNSDEVQLHHDHHTPPSPSRHNESIEGTMTDSTVMQQNGGGDDFDTCAKEMTITTKDMSDQMSVSMGEVGTVHDNDTTSVKKTSSTNDTDDDMNQLPTQEETCTTPAIIVDQDLQHKPPVDIIDVPTRPPETGHDDEVQLHHDHHTPPSPTRHKENIEGTMTDLTVMHKNREGDDYGTCAKEETITTEDTSKIVGVRIEKVGASRDNDTPLVKKASSTNEANDDMNEEDDSIKREQTSATGDWNVEWIDADDTDTDHDALSMMDVASIYHDAVTQLIPNDSSIIDGGNCIVSQDEPGTNTNQTPMNLPVDENEYNPDNISDSLDESGSVHNGVSQDGGVIDNIPGKDS